MTTSSTAAISNRSTPFSTSILVMALGWLIVIIAGCATQPEKIPTEFSDPAKLENWQIEGKLGFRSPEKNGSAFFRWRQQGAAYDVQLNGPFGAAATTIRGDRDFAVLRQAGEEDLLANNGEQLTAQLFGWAFPIAEMPFWVKGLAAPTSRAKTTVTEANVITSLDQQGWHLEFTQYARQGNWYLPTRIKGQQHDYSFTLVIKKWALETDQLVSQASE